MTFFRSGASRGSGKVLDTVFIVYIIVVAAAAIYVTAPPSSSPAAPSSVSSSSFSSTASSSGAPFPYGGGVFDTPGNLLISDQFNNRVIEVDPLNNGLVWSFGSGNGSLCNPGPGSIIGPNDAERLAGGLTLMAGSGIPAGVAGTAPCVDNRVIIVNQQGSITWQYGQAGVNGSGPDQLNTPVFAIQLPNQDIAIVDQGNARVIVVNSTKQIVWSYGPSSGPGALQSPNSVEQLTNGDYLIADQNNNRVIEVNRTGAIVWQYSQGLDIAAFASRLPNNDTLIADAADQRVVEVNMMNQTVWQFFTNETQGSTAKPYPSNAVRLADGDTSITDTLNDRIIVVNVQGQIVYQYGTTNLVGNGPDQLFAPYSGYVIGDYTGQTPPPGLTPTG
jgi:hypothetical protein